MKQLFIILLFTSISVFADDPNFDSSTGVVTFPRITVDNSAEFFNIQLLLNPDGTWALLAAEPDPEPTINLTGNWSGLAISNVFSGCTGDLSGTISQNGSQLTGSGTLTGDCISGGSGSLSGEINGNTITFGLVFNNNTSISFDTTISDDQRTFSGSYNWPDVGDRGTVTFTLQ